MVGDNLLHWYEMFCAIFSGSWRHANGAGNIIGRVAFTRKLVSGLARSSQRLFWAWVSDSALAADVFRITSLQ